MSNVRRIFESAPDDGVTMQCQRVGDRIEVTIAPPNQHDRVRFNMSTDLARELAKFILEEVPDPLPEYLR